MRHLISSDALNKEVKELRKAAKKTYSHFNLIYKGFNIEFSENNNYGRIVALFDTQDGMRVTQSSII